MSNIILNCIGLVMYGVIIYLGGFNSGFAEGERVTITYNPNCQQGVHYGR